MKKLFLILLFYGILLFDINAQSTITNTVVLTGDLRRIIRHSVNESNESYDIPNQNPDNYYCIGHIASQLHVYDEYLCLINFHYPGDIPYGANITGIRLHSTTGLDFGNDQREIHKKK